MPGSTRPGLETGPGSQRSALTFVLHPLLSCFSLDGSALRARLRQVHRALRVDAWPLSRAQLLSSLDYFRGRSPREVRCCSTVRRTHSRMSYVWRHRPIDAPCMVRPAPHDRRSTMRTTRGGNQCSHWYENLGPTIGRTG